MDERAFQSLLVSHYENNYGGALRRLNAIRARLAALDWARTPTFEINGLKREELIARGHRARGICVRIGSRRNMALCSDTDAYDDSEHLNYPCNSRRSRWNTSTR
jgi:hypothetical protein